MENFDLDRFIKAQKRKYNIAFSEIREGKKQTHWIWYIFPQIKGLGQSETAKYYSIQSIDEAKAYLDNTYLYNNLIDICNELLKLKSNNILDIMGYPDNLKLCSSMTLFYLVAPKETIFKKILDKFYDGKLDENTIILCNNSVSKNKKSNSGIIGLAIGDALGVPAEFKTREELSLNPITDMIGFGTYNVPAGTWSDDTAMTLATIDSIIDTKTINPNDMASKFLDWFRNCNYTATGEVFDIGRTTIQALAKFELKLDNASSCGKTDEYSNGNGSLMRILPITYYIYYTNITNNQEIYNIVKQVSSITHAHDTSILGCYIYVRFALELLNGKDKVEAYKNIQKLDYSMFNNNTINRYNRILRDDIKNISENNISSSGYVVSTLETTMWLFLNSDDYNTTILKAVNLGEDTDTISACTGGLLGIYYGIESINDSWKQNLKKYEYITNLCDKFDKILYN